MAYVSNSNLSQFWGLAKKFIGDHYGNWQKTSAAGTVTCYPVPASPLEPTVSFAFTETPPAGGDKAPDNPSNITGVTSVTVTHCESAGVDETAYTVSLGGTLYGGTVDFSTGTITGTWGGEMITVFTGVSAVLTDTIICTANSSFIHKGAVNPVGVCTSDRFIPMSGNSDIEHFRQSGSAATGATGLNFWVAKSRLDVSGAADPSSPTAAEWLSAANAWLAENPIFYVGQRFSPVSSQTPSIQILSLEQSDKYTPRLNTILSDQTSVQVGYIKSPMIS